MVKTLLKMVDKVHKQLFLITVTDHCLRF